MSRFVDAFKLALAACLALAIGLASVPSFADIDRAFTQFEAPDTTQVLANCKNDEVLRRMRELDAAAERLRVKIDRIDRAKRETLNAAYATHDPVRRRILLNDYNTLNHWGAVWRDYRSGLERQIAYYKALPPCGGGKRERRSIAWPGESRAPVSVGPITPVETDGVCVTREGADLIATATSSAKAAADQVKRIREFVEADMNALDELTAKGQGDSARARELKERIELELNNLQRAEELIEKQNRRIRELQQRYRCAPTDPQQGSLRLGSCEAGVLAQVNAARADPPAYSMSLLSARGRYAAEAREFLSRQAPIATLRPDARLMAAARSHGDDLAARNAASHTGAGGRGLLARLHEQGMFVTMAAEVISTGRDRPADAVRALVIDEGHPGGPHRKDLFNVQFTLVGIACVRTRSHGQLVIIDLSNAPLAREGA